MFSLIVYSKVISKFTFSKRFSGNYTFSELLFLSLQFVCFETEEISVLARMLVNETFLTFLKTNLYSWFCFWCEQSPTGRLFLSPLKYPNWHNNWPLQLYFCKAEQGKNKKKQKIKNKKNNYFHKYFPVSSQLNVSCFKNPQSFSNSNPIYKIFHISNLYNFT